MNRAYVVLILILIIPISAHAQNEVEPWSNGNNSDYYLLSETELGEELWGPAFDLTYLELFWVDIDTLYDILLELCLDLGVTDEEIYEMFPDLWEPDYELYLFWEDDWYY